MEDTNVSPAQQQPNADQRLAELEQRYAASSSEGKRLAESERKWQAYAQQLEQQIQQAQQPAAGSSPEDRIREALTTFGIPPSDFDQYIQSKTQQVVQNEFRPITQSFAAQNELIAEYGEDYQKYNPEAIRYVNSDPSLANRFNQMLRADAHAANEWAYLKYADQQRRQAPQSNGQAIQSAQVQASIPQSRSGDARMGSDADSTGRELWAKYLETRDPRYRDAYVKVRYSQAIPDEFLNR